MMSYEQILDTITDAEVMTAYTANDSLAVLDSKILSESEQKLNLAFWAKATMSHVGWDSFGEDNQNQFQKKVEELYNQINGAKNQKEFMAKVAIETKGYIKDRHYGLTTGSGSFKGGGEMEKPRVGENIAFRKDKPAGFELVAEERKLNDSGEEYPLWQIGTMNKSGEDILVVSIPNLPQTPEENDYEHCQRFIETFDKEYEKIRNNKDSRIILDVRGNFGGEDKPIDHIAKRLYGNLVNTYKRCEISDTAISNKFLHDHGAYKPQSYEKDGIKKENLIERKYFSNKNQILFDETGIYYPFNEDKGYKGKIDILIDRGVGSSAESAYTSFYHHPNVRYVGENTKGMQQFTQGTFSMPCGYSMRVGVTKLTYWDKEGENIEVNGHKPDVDCKGKDALEMVLTMDKDTVRILESRELNEQITGEKVYADYNPRDGTDPRKAYYAKYLEPALAKLEEKNIRFANVRQKLENKNQSATAEDKQPSSPSVNPSRDTTSSAMPLRGQLHTKSER